MLHKRLLQMAAPAVLGFLLSATTGFADDVRLASNADLLSMDIEALMNVEVYSASKRPEKLYETTSAVYVINREDIRRSGATSIPELMRLVPGMQVARLDSFEWAISSRGWNGKYARMLVLIDGRQVFTPLFGGTYWNRLDQVMEDIDRIEVVRGPGATVWGANSANGVVNIITKGAAQTQGLLVSGLAGNQDRAGGAIRYGSALGESTDARAWATYGDNAPLTDRAGNRLSDSWNLLKAGFRMDSALNAEDDLSVQGESFGTNITYNTYDDSGAVTSEDQKGSGGHLMGVWNRRYSEDNTLRLQAYFDRSVRTQPSSSENIDTFDLEFNNTLAFQGRHMLVWGAGYRNAAFANATTGAVYYNRPQRTIETYSGFLDIEANLAPSLSWSIGSRVEQGGYATFDYEPSTRLLWEPAERQAVWLAFARTVRTPTRADQDMGLAMSFMDLLPAPNLQSEIQTSSELGYRVTPADTLSLDMVAYYYDYDSYTSVERNRVNGKLTFQEANYLRGYSEGFDFSFSYMPTSYWKLEGNYSVMTMATWFRAGSLARNDGVRGLTGTVPFSSSHVRSYLDLPHGFQFDALYYHVDQLDYYPDLPAYDRVDFRLGYSASKNLSASFVVQNSFNASHSEFFDPTYTPKEAIPQSYYLKLTYTM